MLVRLVRPAACGALHGAQTMIALAMMPGTASTMLLIMGRLRHRPGRHHPGRYRAVLNGAGNVKRLVGCRSGGMNDQR